MTNDLSRLTAPSAELVERQSPSEIVARMNRDWLDAKGYEPFSLDQFKEKYRAIKSDGHKSPKFLAEGFMRINELHRLVRLHAPRGGGRKKKQPPTPEHLDRSKLIYFFRCVPDGPIKIGYTVNVARRFQSVQVSCPYELEFMGSIAGNPGDEKKIHARFEGQRIRGEWFEASPDLLEFISKEASK